MLDIARLAETHPYFYVDAHTVDIFTKPQH